MALKPETIIVVNNIPFPGDLPDCYPHCESPQTPEPNFPSPTPNTPTPTPTPTPPTVPPELPPVETPPIIGGVELPPTVKDWIDMLSGDTDEGENSIISQSNSGNSTVFILIAVAVAVGGGIYLWRKKNV